MGVKKGTRYVMVQMTIFFVFIIPAPAFIWLYSFPGSDARSFALGVAVGIVALWAVSMAALWAMDSAVDSAYQKRAERWQQKSEVERQIIQLRNTIFIGMFLLFVWLMR